MSAVVKEKPSGRRSLGQLVRGEIIAIAFIFVSILAAIALVVFDVTDPVLGFVVASEITLTGLLLQHMVDSAARAELNRALKGTGHIRERIVAIGDSVARLRADYAGTEAEEVMNDRLSAWERELNDLSHGLVQRDGDSYTDLFRITERARHRLRGITNVLDQDGRSVGAWWHSSIGKRYWQQNLDAMQRGVAIERIFIFSSWSPALAALVQTQAAAGVSVRLLESSMVDPKHHINITLWDDATAWEAKMNARGIIVANLLHLNSVQVERIAAEFEICERSSEAYDPASPERVPAA